MYSEAKKHGTTTMPRGESGRGHGGAVLTCTHSCLTGLKYLLAYLIPGTWYRDGPTALNTVVMSALYDDPEYL